MNKLVPLLFAGTGTAAVSIGGFYLVKNGGIGGVVDSGDSPARTITPDASSDTLDFATLQGFKDGKGGICVKKLFGSEGIDFGNKGEAIDASKKLDGTEFTSAESVSNPPKGCLVVNWDRTNYSSGTDTKWRGHFR